MCPSCWRMHTREDVLSRFVSGVHGSAHTLLHAGIAQLGRAPASKAGCSRFESVCRCHFFIFERESRLVLRLASYARRRRSSRHSATNFIMPLYRLVGLSKKSPIHGILQWRPFWIHANGPYCRAVSEYRWSRRGVFHGKHLSGILRCNSAVE